MADDKKEPTKPKSYSVGDVNDDPSLVESLSLDNAKELLDSGGLAGDLSQRITGYVGSFAKDTNDGD